jgi:hypothetical protein
MYKIVPVIVALTVATFFVGYSTIQMDRTSNILKYGTPEPPGWARETLKKREEATAEATPRWSSNNDHDEPAFKIMLRFLGDTDDLLDTVKDPASFDAVKPRILRRARRHAEIGKDHPDKGMKQLSKAEAKEFDKALKRHAASMLRADSVAPGVTDFFKDEVGPTLEAK